MPTNEPMHSGLPNRIVSPPGGWRCRMPETGQEFKGASSQQVISQLRASYKANGYPEPADYMAMVEAYVCSKQPDYCTGNHPANVPIEGFTFHTVLQGLRTLGQWSWHSLKRGARQYVPQELANERARTCTTSGPGGTPCPFNDEPQGCTSCNAASMQAAVRIIVGERSTSSDAGLKSCRICNCGLKAKVHLPHAVLYDNMPQAQFEKLPPYCWMVTEVPLATTP